jgi:transcriptional antiterminator NusG
MKQTKNSETGSAGVAAKSAKHRKEKPSPSSEVETPEVGKLESVTEAEAPRAEDGEPRVEDVGPETEGVAAATEDAGSADESQAAQTEGAVPQVEGAPAPEEGAAAPAESTEPAAEAEAPKHWFVVHTYSGHENKVKANLERAIASQAMQPNFGQVLVATEDFAEMKDGKKTITKRKTFPSYVLIEMDMSNETRHLVTNIPGVTGFVGTGRDPIPLRVEEVRRVLGLDAEGKVAKPTPSVPFKIGEHVRVVDGPFSDFTGVVDEVNSERGKVKVMVSIFGRATPVELDFLQVQSI